MAKMTKILGAMALSAGLCALPALAGDLTPETVVATVNGKPVTLGEMIVMRASLPQQYLSLPDDVLFKGILDQMVQQSALEQSVEPTLSKKDRIQIENDRRSALAAIALQDVVQKAVTDTALQAAYDAKYKDFKPGTEYHAAHILVDSEEKAKEIKAQIEGGVLFADAAKTHGTDGTAASGGDLGWFGAGMMVKPFEDAVAAMKPGELVGPVQTEFGWHLIQLIETRPASAPALDDVREDLAAELEQKAVQAHVEAVTKAAKVEKPGEGIDPAVLKDETLLDK
ncbi:peptidyl-prolyl cis-trans isomerase C [Gemmobacter aquatilis]|uniref:Parvulin-like PPIase n=1 Tax=Gemmobacter aquatilis TaxID=933059 RepID=A0A1H8A357_9RHOB|nr:peptidylprolyl isomerase [Gemmobacter aquatilis]SEM64926.1 peptidyl-prolyl cis-trans isomerase C [Gemmobacter aquatilis]